MGVIDKIILISGENILGIIFVYLILNCITIFSYLFFIKMSKKYENKTIGNIKENNNHYDEKSEEIKKELENILKKNEQKSVYYAYIFIILFVCFIITIILNFIYKIPKEIIFFIFGTIILFSMYTVIHFFEYFIKNIFKR